MCALAAPVVVSAQQKPPAASTDDDPDRDPNLAQPDFTLVNLPTTLRVPKFKSAFRVTHRFTRPLGEGDFGDLADDLFGLDSGAQIGLEYRFGLMRGTQVGIYRTTDRTIEFFAQYESWQREAGFRSLARHDRRHEQLPRQLHAGTGRRDLTHPRQHGALYLEPIWVNNSNRLPSEVVEENDTFMVGRGARLRVRPTVYVVGAFLARRIRSGSGAAQVRPGKARGRPHVSADDLEQLRHDDGSGRARRPQQRRLAHRVRYFEKVLLRSAEKGSPISPGLSSST